MPSRRIEKPPVYVGIDVGKYQLDAASSVFHLEVKNVRSGHRALLEEASKHHALVHFVYESSPYARVLTRFFQKENCRFSVVDSYRARQFAKATGKLAKTDRIDALLLARMGEAMKPAQTPHRSKETEMLMHVSRRRGQLTRILRTLQVQHHTLWLPSLRAESRKLLAEFKGQLHDVDERLRVMIAKSKRLSRRVAKLAEVSGVGEYTARRLVAELPELGQLSRKAVASLAGLAPIANESGSLTGKRHIGKGRSPVRALMYMSTMVGISSNPVLREFYQRLRTRGKTHRVALTATMRRFLTYLNHVARENTAAVADSISDVMLKRRGKDWSKSEDDELRRQLSLSIPQKMIAQTLGRTTHSINCRAVRIGAVLRAASWTARRREGWLPTKSIS